MRRARILLVKILDAMGASIADARVHARALAHSGSVRVLVVPSARSGVPDEDAELDGLSPSSRMAIAVGRESVREAIAEWRPDRIVAAAATRDVVEHWIGAAARPRWWPTGVGVRPGGPCSAPASKRLIRGCAWLLAASPRQTGEVDPGPFAGLERAVIERFDSFRVGRSPWDGDYVLVPVPLAGAAGREALAVFAAVAADWTSYDLVVLGPPNDEFAAQARRLGIGARVHFAGPAPRRAEYAWAQAATAAIVAAPGPLAAGIAMRVLSSRCPLLTIGSVGAAGIVGRWLDHHGCAQVGSGSNPTANANDLGRVLERGREVEAAIERGHDLAALHDLDHVAPRLAAALDLDNPLAGEAA